jgi:hypothetical protein
MPRVAPKSLVEPKMLRHFAVLTLALTGLLAMFAIGEDRKAFEEELAERRENKELKQAELELAKQGKGGNTTLVFKDNRKTKTTWAPDYGQPGVNHVPIDGAGSPELAAGRGPQFIDITGTARQGSEQLTAAPPGMNAETIRELQNKTKKKGVRKEEAEVRPPLTEEEWADD